MGDTHVFVSHDDFGFYVQSPQLPGYAYGRPTLTELRRDYREDLRLAGAQGNVIGHIEDRYETPEGVQFIIRRCTDEGREPDERSEAANRIYGVAMQTEQRFMLMENERNLVGDVVLVAALPGDALGFFIDQLDPRGDAFALALAVGDQAVFTTQLASEGRVHVEGWESLASHGWTRDTTLSTVMQQLSTTKPLERTLVLSG